MSGLAINGLTVPVLANSASWQLHDNGGMVRGFHGDLTRPRVRTAPDISFDTAPMSENDATVLESMMYGYGEGFSFDTAMGLYSGKGTYPTSVTGCASQTGEKKHGTAGLSITAGNSFTWYSTGGFGSVGSTVMVWREETAGGGFTHYIQTFPKTGTGSYWTSGASKTSGTLSWMTSGSISASGATRYYDQLVILRGEASDAFVAELYAEAAANSGSYVMNGAVQVKGDFMDLTDAATSTRNMVGECTQKAVSCVLAGTFTHNARVLSVKLYGT